MNNSKMEPHFTVFADASRCLMRIWMAGFFKPADVSAFSRERDAVYKQLRCAPNQHLTLVDIREMAVQSQDAVCEFEKALHTPHIYSRRIAIVTRTSLSRTQVKRAAHGRSIAYFEDVLEAEHWLMNSDAVAA